MSRQNSSLSPKVHRFSADKEYLSEEGCYINELSNDADDPAVSIAQARVAVGDTTAWHRLTGIVERYVVISGTGLAEVSEAAPLPVGPGDVVIVPAGSRQRISNSGQNDLVFLCICTPRFEWQYYERLEP
ncbi:MAG: cupin domain-containing protein [Gammaproteobacteria bacterium]